LPDTTTEVRAILARTLRELEQVIDNAYITSFLRGLGSVLGLEDDGATATTKPTSQRAATAKPKRVTASRASTTGAARLPQATTAKAKAHTRTPAKPKPASTPRASASAPRARAGTRRDQLLALVTDQPGITLAQAAKQLGLKDATSLYAAARRLQDDGLVQKTGVELHPAAKAQPK
jgi:hypothetical protein